MKKLIILIVGISIIGAIAWWALMSGVRTSAHSYEALERETDTYIAATFLPGADGNPVRNELNRMLGESLSDILSETERLERARRGLVLLDELERQIDAIGETKSSLDARLTALDEELAYIPSLLSGDRRRLREHVERLYVIADDIRGLSCRANYHTSQIFDRIITDGGVLTVEHITFLNGQIPQIETQFDERTNLYAELESIESALGILYKDLLASSQAFPLSLFAE